MSFEGVFTRRSKLRLRLGRRTILKLRCFFDKIVAERDFDVMIFFKKDLFWGAEMVEGREGKRCGDNPCPYKLSVIWASRLHFISVAGIRATAQLCQS